MQAFKITYRFGLPNGREEVFCIDIDAERIELVDSHQDKLPAWTRLDFHQCPNCPLTINEFPNCPLMMNLAHVVEPFNNIISHDKVHLEVKTEERLVSQQTTAQRGISSLMGLLIGVSRCPHTVFFKPMARFHLPLATEEETLYRATSMYLLAQYFIRLQGKKIDFNLEGFLEIYSEMHTVNMSVANRLREAGKTDSSTNALILLDMYAKAVPFVIDESLDELQYLFAPYLTACDSQQIDHSSETTPQVSDPAAQTN